MLQYFIICVSDCTYFKCSTKSQLLAISVVFTDRWPDQLQTVLLGPTSNAIYSHCKVFQAHYRLSGVIILTLFFWQVSQRDHALHSDKTQSTGWTTTRPPAERASRTPGSSLLAAVMATSLWHEDQKSKQKDTFSTVEAKGLFFSLRTILVGLATDRSNDLN